MSHVTGSIRGRAYILCSMYAPLPPPLTPLQLYSSHVAGPYVMYINPRVCSKTPTGTPCVFLLLQVYCGRGLCFGSESKFDPYLSTLWIRIHTTKSTVGEKSGLTGQKPSLFRTCHFIFIVFLEDGVQRKIVYKKYFEFFHKLIMLVCEKGWIRI